MKKTEWIKNLDQETINSMNSLLLKTFKHKKSYLTSKDPHLAQLWLVLVEIHKTQIELEKRIESIEKFFNIPKKYSLIPDLEEY